MCSYVVSIIYEISLCCLVQNRHSISSAYFSLELLIILAVNISLSLLSRLLIPEILTGFPKYWFSYTMLKKRRCFMCLFVFDHSYGLWPVLTEVTAGVVVMMINTRHDNTLRGVPWQGQNRVLRKHRGESSVQTQEMVKRHLSWAPKAEQTRQANMECWHEEGREGQSGWRELLCQTWEAREYVPYSRRQEIHHGWREELKRESDKRWRDTEPGATKADPPGP